MPRRAMLEYIYIFFSFGLILTLPPQFVYRERKQNFYRNNLDALSKKYTQVQVF